MDKFLPNCQRIEECGECEERFFCFTGGKNKEPRVQQYIAQRRDEEKWRKLLAIMHESEENKWLPNITVTKDNHHRDFVEWQCPLCKTETIGYRYLSPFRIFECRKCDYVKIKM